jgi:hypothetical protein
MFRPASPRPACGRDTRVAFDPIAIAAALSGVIPRDFIDTSLADRLPHRSAGTSDLTRSPRALTAEISRYCAEHPGARDTLEGIAWWLAIQRSSDTLEELRAAVDVLIERNVLVPHRLTDGRTLYGCSGDADAKAARARKKPRVRRS